MKIHLIASLIAMTAVSLGMGAVPVSAADKTVISLVSATITKPFMPTLVASFEKSHPNVSVVVTYAGGKIASGVVEHGGPDAVIMTESFAQKISSLLDNSSPAFGMHTGIIVSKSSSGKIKEAKDLAKPGVHLGGGQDGSQSQKYQYETAQKLDKKYGGDFYKKYVENVVMIKPETPALLPLIESGQVDAAIVITAEMDKSKFTVIPLASSESASFRLNAAVVKSSTHANEAKQLVAFLLSPEAQSVYRSYGYDDK